MAASPHCAYHSWIAAGLLALVSLAGGPLAADDQPLFKSKQLTDPHTSPFTSGIEGPAVDAEGNLYVVNFKAPNTDGKGTIGKLAKDSTTFAPFTVLHDPNSTKQSIGNGIRFDRDGRMYIADFVNHNVFVIERGQTNATPYFHSDDFHEPNDLAVAKDGTLYASDPDFSAHADPNKKGQIWQITRGPDGKAHGQIMQIDRPKVGLTNGIDLSPDETTLYVSQSDTFEVWAYRIDGIHLRDPRLVKAFGPHKDIDGLRTDVDGRIFVARPEHQQIAIIKPDGTLLPPVTTVGKKPSNLTFGGPDGRTVFVTQVDGLFIESFRTDRPGREPCLQTQAPGMC